MSKQRIYVIIINLLVQKKKDECLLSGQEAIMKKHRPFLLIEKEERAM